MTKILDGRKLSGEIAFELEKKIKNLKAKPKLVIIQVGNLPESNSYIGRKIAFGEKIGAKVEHIKFPNKVREKKLIDAISKCNKDKSVHGIIVQLPLPKYLNPPSILEAVAEEKRVDGGKYFIPATTRGILTILEKNRIKLIGKKAVVVGRSELVGKPTALALINLGATVTVCHSQTKNLKAETKQAEILVVAVGKPKLIGKNHVRKGQIVIDVGINIAKNKKLVGDVDFKSVSKIVKAITPVPGGIGPMTVTSLFENLLKAYFLQTK
jgi:methylenetetrahydrofolate dehydrogenase (NADP+) / methenyltetrahydrofolate cyclohydrolase